MLVSVIYFDPSTNAYQGQEYTYRTKLPLQLFQKVIAPTYKGDKKALVVNIDLPETSVDPAWAARTKYISLLDTGD